MQVLQGHSYDHAHMPDGNGAYEWWYVDASSANGEWGLVAIVFRGMPMSPDLLAALPHGHALPADHCGYAVSVYHRNRRIASAFRGVPKEQCAFSTHECDVTTGPVRFRREADGSYRLTANTALANVPHALQIDASFTPCTGLAGRASDPEPHAWIVAAPRMTCSVACTFLENGMPAAETSWEGMAYHDHNLGVRHMGVDHGDWYWGRVHTPDRTFVYLATPDAAQPTHWLGVIDADGLSVCTNVDVRFSHRRRTFMGLSTYRCLTMHATTPSGVPLTLTCTNDRIVENGPFYQRYIAAWQVDNAPVLRGMSEYMDCNRYHQAWIRPFLRTLWQVHR